MAKKNSSKFTRQGVRNLDYLPAPKPKRIEVPEDTHKCEHPRAYLEYRKGNSICPDCGESLADMFE